jgi:hypothetical protein
MKIAPFNQPGARQGKPGMKNEAFRWNRLWCLESNLQVDTKERLKMEGKPLFWGWETAASLGLGRCNV